MSTPLGPGAWSNGEHLPSTTYGSIAIDAASGAWLYTLYNTLAATQALKEGETATETFTARATDEFGAWVDQTITLTINGTNDVPVVSNASSAPARRRDRSRPRRRRHGCCRCGYSPGPR